MTRPAVLVLNAGSSSLKYRLIDPLDGTVLGWGLVERIGEARGAVHHHGPHGVHDVEEPVADHEAALRAALDAFAGQGPALDSVDLAAVGHRLVHGGARFSAPVLVDDALITAVDELSPLAPLHNPANLTGIRGARALFPDLPHVAVFDTAFHQSLPPAAYTYAVPRSWREEHGIRRYGFHGTSVAFVSRAAAELLARPVEDLSMIVLHLGNGASATAVAGGRSVDTSMGFTPLEGLVMGSRSGDLDPAVPLYLERHLGLPTTEIESILNHDSGLKGLVGHNDVRELIRLRESGDATAALAFDVYVHRLRKYVGAYLAVLRGADAIVFTGGVGEHQAEVRRATLEGLEFLGISLDSQRNEAGGDGGSRVVSSDDSAVSVLVVPTDEEWEIARQAWDLVGRD